MDGGHFVDQQGKVLGKHKGYPFYTIGQRKGLEVALGSPAYVTAIIPETNTVVLGAAEDLEKQRMRVRNVNLIKYPTLLDPIDTITKIRYKDPGSPALVEIQGNEAIVTFQKPVSAIAPGQSAVFYEGEDVIGGGFIDRSQAN